MLSPLPSNSDQQSRLHKYPSYTIGVLTDDANKFTSKRGHSFQMFQLRLWDQDRHPSTLPPFSHVSYSSPSSLHQHFLYCISDTSTFILQSVLRSPSIAYVLWFCTICIFSRWCYIFSGCCLASCLLHCWSYEKWQNLETLGGIEGWRNFVLHLAWKRTISTRDHISFHHHCHCHHLQIVYGQWFTA